MMTIAGQVILLLTAACPCEKKAPTPATAATVRAFRADCAARARAAGDADAVVVTGRDGWYFLTRELRHVGVGKFWGPDAAKVGRATRPGDADPLPAILNFHAQLKALGIQLILVPVPAKAFVYPEKISNKIAASKNAPPPRLDAAHLEFYNKLRAAGIDVLDLTPVLLDQRMGSAGTMYCKQDTHWSGRACEVAAKLIAKKLSAAPWFEKVPKTRFSHQRRQTQISGDLWREVKGDKPPAEVLPLRHVGVQGADGLTPLRPNRDSPVILLGDSHTLVFQAGDDMHAKGAGLADQLALELGFAVDLIGVRGSGATPARTNLYWRGKTAGYLDKKKAVVWCFSAREFTESDGWRLVPVKKAPNWRTMHEKKAKKRS